MAHYVVNADFLAAIIEMKAKVADAKEKGLPKPVVSNYIGECILKIATHLSYKPNFINYSYREEMISDGIENCLQYIDNVDPSNPIIPFHILHRLSTMHFYVALPKKRNKHTSKVS